MNKTVYGVKAVNGAGGGAEMIKQDSLLSQDSLHVVDYMWNKMFEDAPRTVLTHYYQLTDILIPSKNGL